MNAEPNGVQLDPAPAFEDPYADMVFEDAEPKFVHVTIGRERYILREATEDVACKFHNVAMRAARMTDGKVTGVDGVADAEPVLVAGCLFKIVPDPKSKTGGTIEQLVILQQVRQFPSRIIKSLFERAKKISGLDEADTEEAIERRIKADTERLEKLRAAKGAAPGPKGSPTSTTGTSDSAESSGEPSTS